MKKRLLAAILGLSIIMMAGCGPKNMPAQETPAADSQAVEEAAVETEPSADSAEETVSEEELQATLKEEYLAKIDACIEQKDYETAYSLIKEGNEALNGNDLDDKLSEIPDAVQNDVKFEKISTVDSVLWVIFIEKKDGDWYLVSNPDLSYKDASTRLEVKNIEKRDLDDENKEYKIRFRQTPVYTVSYPAKDGEPSWYYCLEDLTFFDYYTGQTLKTIDTSLDSGENSKEGETGNMITWKSTEYTVSINVKKDRSDEKSKDLSAPSGMTEKQYESEITFKYTITCPKDYDGLCAYLTKTSALPSDAEKNYARSLFDADGKAVEGDTGTETGYVFKDKNTYGIIPTADTIYAMRVDDVAAEETAEAADPNTAADNKQAIAAPKADKLAAEPVQTAPAAVAASTTGHPLNLDPEVDYGLPDWVKTEEDYAKYLGVEYVSEEDFNNYHPSQEFIDWFNTLNIE